MTIGTKSGFQVYNEYIHTGLVETLTQASDAFNAASRGAIRLTGVNRQGDYVYESFFQNISGLITRRITAGSGSTDAVDDQALTQDDDVAVKLNRKIGPVANTLDSFKKIRHEPFDEDALNFVIGQMAGKAMPVEMLNTTLRAMRAALDNQADVSHTISSNGLMNTLDLVTGLAQFGDAADRVILWVMHSKPYYDLVKDQIVDNIDGISNFNVASASPVTLNRPVLVTDSPALTASSPTDYYTLGLTMGAAEVEDSEETTLHSEFVTGKENLVVRYQGEYAYNLKLKGFTYDTTAGENPTDNLIGTGSNWDPTRASFKDFAGLVIQSR